MQRALVFLGVVLAVVIMGWLDQRRESSLLRAELSKTMSALSADPDSIKLVEATTDLSTGTEKCTGFGNRKVLHWWGCEPA